jgi:Xaa-Pro dipeptidase
MGFPGDASVMVDEYTASPHGSTTPQVMPGGSIIMIDDGCTVEGYQSDITRTFVLGKASSGRRQDEKSVRDRVARAIRGTGCGASSSGMRGNRCRRQRKSSPTAGFGPDYKYFTHRLGHGLGMDGHEWPYLVRGNHTKLQANMTTSDEPGIYIPGEFGIRLEDDLHVTENGAELFTPQSPSLEDPFGKG